MNLRRFLFAGLVLAVVATGVWAFWYRVPTLSPEANAGVRIETNATVDLGPFGTAKSFER